MVSGLRDKLEMVFVNLFNLFLMVWNGTVSLFVRLEKVIDREVVIELTF